MQKYYLGIDYGDSKIGLALADNETKMAFGHCIIANDQNLFIELKKLFDDYDIKIVVVGIPEFKTYENEKKIKEFADKIKKEFNAQVSLQSEMFTTKLAQTRLKEAQKKNLGKIDDMEAAKIILQDWLDRFTT